MQKLDITNSVGTMIALAAKSMERLAELEMKKQLGLTPAQWKVILVLNITPGLTQKEVSEKIFVDGSTLVPVIDKMQKNGLIERRVDPKDRRINRLFLTKKSESTIDSIILVVMQLRKIVYKGISETEMNKTRETVQNIMKNADDAITKIKSLKESK